MDTEENKSALAVVPVNPDLDYKLGELHVSAKDIPPILVKFDRIAFVHSRLMFLSVFAEKGRVKQLRAMFSPGVVKQLYIQSDLKCRRASGHSESRNTNSPIGLSITTEGYTIRKKDLDFNMAHAMFIAKDPGFMLVTSPVTLFEQIKRSTLTNPITTPFIPEWLGYIEKKLRYENLMEDCWCHRCGCSVFTATTSSLERLIKHGLEYQEIHIPPPPARPDTAWSGGGCIVRNALP